MSRVACHLQERGDAALIPGAALSALPNRGDLPQIENFDVFTRVLADRRWS